MSSHPFDKLPLESSGALIFTPCPGTKGVGLAESLAQLAEAGTVAVVTLMPDDEMLGNEVSEMPQICEQVGIRWFHFPIEDDCPPGAGFHQAWQRDKRELLDTLDSGQTVAIHCKGGSGRTGLMAATIMLERGIPCREVVEKVRGMRPRSLKLAVHVGFLAEAYDRKIASMLRDMDSNDPSA